MAGHSREPQEWFVRCETAQPGGAKTSHPWLKKRAEMFSGTERRQAARVASLTGAIFKESLSPRERTELGGRWYIPQDPRCSSWAAGLSWDSQVIWVGSHTVQGAEHLVHPESDFRGPDLPLSSTASQTGSIHLVLYVFPSPTSAPGKALKQSYKTQILVFLLCLGFHHSCLDSTVFRSWTAFSKISRELSRAALGLFSLHLFPYSTGCVPMLSRVQLFETPWTGARQAPLSMGFSRQEYWSGFPFPSPTLLVKSR